MIKLYFVVHLNLGETIFLHILLYNLTFDSCSAKFFFILMIILTLKIPACKSCVYAIILPLSSTYYFTVLIMSLFLPHIVAVVSSCFSTIFTIFARPILCYLRFGFVLMCFFVYPINALFLPCTVLSLEDVSKFALWFGF